MGSFVKTLINIRYTSSWLGIGARGKCIHIVVKSRLVLYSLSFTLILKGHFLKTVMIQVFIINFLISI